MFQPALTRSTLIQSLLGMSMLCLTIGTYAAPIQFEDTSDKLGFTRGTETWGIAWGNITGDKWPDIYNQAHRDFPRIYRNAGNGDFDDVAGIYDQNMNDWHLSYTQRDVHAGALGDFDNDGDDDIIVGDEDEFFTNHAESGGYFTVGTKTTNFSYAAWNNDPPSNSLYSDTSCNGQYILLFDLDGDGDKDEICGKEGVFPKTANSHIPNVNQSNDAAFGDFNNDGISDLIVTRGSTRPSGAAKVNDNRIEAWFRSNEGASFTFAATGQVTFTFDGTGGGIFLEADVVVLNTSGTTSTTKRGVTVSYDQSTQLWLVEDTYHRQAYVRIDTQNTASEPVNSSPWLGDQPLETYHGVNSTTGITWVYNTGLFDPRYCVSVVTADFDNDMDLDLYMACREGASNLANKYFDNQGDGTFVEVFNHGGEGPVGAGIEFGTSDSIATADYDIDGFMDLAVTNGLLFYPVSLGGPDTLIHNQGNSNHWIEIDLIGTIGNRSGLGAKVFLTVGGITQLREQGGVYHRWSQSHARIHFGLAQHTNIDEVRIEWPSGQVDVYTNVAADALYDGTEATSLLPAVITMPDPIVIESGEECGQPEYETTLGPAILIWRDCGTDNWHVYERGGLGRLIEGKTQTIAGKVLGSGSFGNVSSTGFTADDSFQDLGTSIDFSITVQDGNGNNSGLDFNTNGQQNTCLNLTVQQPELILIGTTGKRISLPYDLNARTACDPVTDTDGDGILDFSDIDDDNDAIADSAENISPIDADLDLSINPIDLDSDNDSIPDVIEAGLLDVNGDWLVDDLVNQGSVTNPPDTDADGIPDFLDSESNNPANDGTAYDIASTIYAAFDTDGNGVLNSGDTGGGMDADGDGIDDLVDPNSSQHGGSGGNTPPVANPANVVTFIDLPVNITLTGSDINGDPLTFTVESLPADGVLTGTAPNLVYTPNAGYVGVDSFEFSVFDGLAYSPNAAVDITVNNVGASVFCNEPTIDASVDQGTFLWKDCTTDEWSMRVTGGGNSNGLTYTGEIAIPGGLTTLIPVLTEASDILDETDPNAFTYALIVYGNGVDGVDFTLPVGACYTPQSPVGLPVYLGDARVELTTSDISLTTGAACPPPIDTDSDGLSDAEEAVLGTDPLIPDTDVGGVNDGDEVSNGTNPLDGSDDIDLAADACGEPTYSASVDQALFAWKDCSFPGPDARWEVRVTGGGQSYDDYVGALTSDTTLSAIGTGLGGADILDSTPGDNIMDYQLFVGGSGVDGFQIDVPAGSNTCFDPTTLPSGADVRLGINQIVMSGPFQLTDLNPCAVDPACGEPVYDRASEPGVYLWRECNNPASGAVWQVRVVGGGLSWSEFAGLLSADTTLSAAGFSLEGSDTLDSVPGDGQIDFSLYVGGSGEDGFSTEIPPAANSCFDANNLPVGVQVFVGVDKQVMASAFNLEDLGVCI